MRAPAIRVSCDELVVDNFAGGGGASTGIEAAIGRPVDIAINHSPQAIAMHRANHPETKHYCENIWDVDPREACGTRPVGLAWFSPDCTHFSRAKGGKPRSKKIRGLAWVVLRWARAVKPRVILLENVQEFRDWGPLRKDGRPNKARRGETFRAWVSQLTALGYTVDYRALVAADYGTPTTRKRLFLVARRDRQPIVWPGRTHGEGLIPWRSAAGIVDWSHRCPSVFERKRPLAEKTLRRIALGIRRYVLEAHDPFIVPLTHQGSVRVHDIRDPLRTITCANRGELALCAPTLVQTGYGERRGQAPRVLDLHKPVGTIVAGGQKRGLVAAMLTKHYTGVVGQDLLQPTGTITAKDHHALTSATLDDGPDYRTEVRTLLAEHCGFDGEPTVAVNGERYAIRDVGMRMLQPRELFRAQGFDDEYVIAPEFNGKPMTKTAQIALVGNSVCPQVAEALVASNVELASAEPQLGLFGGAS